MTTFLATDHMTSFAAHRNPLSLPAVDITGRHCTLFSIFPLKQLLSSVSPTHTFFHTGHFVARYCCQFNRSPSLLGTKMQWCITCELFHFRNYVTLNRSLKCFSKVQTVSDFFEQITLKVFKVLRLHNKEGHIHLSSYLSCHLSCYLT